MSTISIASYNVKNLFAREDIEQGSRTRPKSERSLAALAESLDRMDADVVTLQELSSRETLENHVLSRRGLAEKYPHIAYIRGNDERGIQIGVISKYPFTEVVTHKDEEFKWVDGSPGTGKFSRDFLRVDINTDDDPEPEVTVYNTHSKSRRPADPGEINSDVRRASEAAAMREIAEREMAPYPSRLFVLTGDFNDNTDDASVQQILNPPNGNERWLDSLDHLPADQRNTWPANPTDRRFPPEQFDHIIYAERFDDQLISSEPIRYEQSLDSDTRWVSSAASDHLPIIAEFEIRD